MWRGRWWYIKILGAIQWHGPVLDDESEELFEKSGQVWDKDLTLLNDDECGFLKDLKHNDVFWEWK